MAESKPPGRTDAPRINLGAGVDLYPVKVIMDLFRIAYQAAHRYLKALGIPRLYINHTAYFNVHSLRRAIYLLSQAGGPGFAFPGSSARNRWSRHKKNPDELPIVLTPKLIKQLERLDPNWDLRVTLEKLLQLDNVAAMAAKLAKGRKSAENVAIRRQAGQRKTS